MKTKILLIITAVLFFNHSVFADSPLTSTDISEAYKDSKIVKKASDAEGNLTIELMKYLTKRKKPIELKIALINELGWNIEGKSNSAIFLEHLKEKYTYKDSDQILNEANGELLICLAYLMALDNYSDVEDAIIYAKKAKAKEANSYTINIVCALIEAQKAMDDNWCEVYTLTNNVRINSALKADMKIEALTIIFEYMDLYKEYCK